MLKGLRRSLKSIGKNKLFRGLGKAVDTVGDFLPPGFRDVANVGGKLMQGQNLKRSLIGAGMDYAGGRIGGALVSKARGVKVPLADKVLKGFDPGSVITNVAQGGTTAINPVSAASGGIGNQILSGVKRGIGGLSAGDIIKGAATGYDIYSNERDRAYQRKRLEKQDKIFDEDRLADQQWFNTTAPLRDAGMSRSLNFNRPDLSSIFNVPRAPVVPITTPDWATLNPRRRPVR